MEFVKAIEPTPGASYDRASEVLEWRETMDLLEQRLTNLWLRHTTPSNHPAAEAEPEQIPNKMGVTFRETTKISDTTLTPGRYVFLLPNPGAEPNHLEIFNDDQTTLVANMTLGDLQFSGRTREAGTAWKSMVEGPRPAKRINRLAQGPPPISAIRWSDTDRTPIGRPD